MDYHFFRYMRRLFVPFFHVGAFLLRFSPYGGPFSPCGGLSAILFSMYGAFFVFMGAFWACPPPLTKISEGAHANGHSRLTE